MAATPKRVQFFIEKTEFTLNYLAPSEARVKRLKKQLKFRLSEGSGEVYMRLGLDSDGGALGLSEAEVRVSVNVVKRLADLVRASATELNCTGNAEGWTAELLIRKNEGPVYVKCALFGPAFEKNEILGYYSQGGLCRAEDRWFRSVFLGFDERNNMSRGGYHAISEDSCKVVNLVDYAVKSNSTKRVVRDVNRHFPDYFILIVNEEVPDQLLGILCNLPQPLILLVDRNNSSAAERVKTLLYRYFCTTILANSVEDAVLIGKTLHTDNVISLFPLDFQSKSDFCVLNTLLSTLPAARCKDAPCQFYVDKVFWKGGLIVGGIPVCGDFHLHKSLLLGPDIRGDFAEVQILGIQVESQDVQSVSSGQFASLKLSLSNSALSTFRLRKGMVLIAKGLSPRSVSTLRCELFIVDPPKNNEFPQSYLPVLNMKNIRVSAAVLEGPRCVLSNEYSEFIFKLLHREFACLGDRVIIHDTLMTAVGEVTQLID